MAQADATYNVKVYIKQGGDYLQIKSGGQIRIESGGQIVDDAGGAPVTLTAPASTAATNSSPYGFSQAQADAIVTWIRAADAQLKLLGVAQ